MNILPPVYWTVALVASVAYSWFAFDIHGVATSYKSKAPDSEKPVEVKQPRAWLWHQRWLNFAGCFVGWCALWPYVPSALACISGCQIIGDAHDAFALFIAFLGITGYIPMAAVGVAKGTGALGNKLYEMTK